MISLVQQHESEVLYKIAAHRDELWSAFQLIQQAYVHRGLAVRNELGMRVTEYHTLPTTEVVIGSKDNEVICTATIVHDGVLGLPMESVYGEQVQVRREQGIKVAEVSCLADQMNGSDRSFPVLARLMCLIAQCSKRRGADELLIAVHPRHAGFYERFLGFRQIGGEERFASVLNLPAVALSLDLNNLADQHPRAYARLFGHPFPVFTLERPRINKSVWSGIRELANHTVSLAKAQIA